MKCPICEVDLIMSEKSGVKVHYCPKCRGIWLDRGELEKIIAKTEGGFGSGKNEFDNHIENEDYRSGVKQKEEYGHSVEKKKSGGSLSDLIDFGGE